MIYLKLNESSLVFYLELLNIHAQKPYIINID